MQNTIFKFGFDGEDIIVEEHDGRNGCKIKEIINNSRIAGVTKITYDDGEGLVYTAKMLCAMFGMKEISDTMLTCVCMNIKNWIQSGYMIHILNLKFTLYAIKASLEKGDDSKWSI